MTTKFIAAVVAAMALSAGTAQAANKETEKAHRLIVERCQAEWPQNYRMQAYCINQQIEALNWIIRNKPTDKAHLDLLADCMGEWADRSVDEHQYNWRMVRYCYDRQREARDFVLRQGGK